MAELLIVDDDLDLADTLAQLLAGLGHDVRVARDGREGLSALDVRKFPDVILLDIERHRDACARWAEYGESDVHPGCRQRADPPRSDLRGCRSSSDRRARRHSVFRNFAPKSCSLDTLLALLEHALRERIPPVPHAPR